MADWFMVLKEVVAMLAEATTILGVIALIYTVRQFKRSEIQRDMDVRMQKIEYSVDLLDAFSKDIIPAINTYIRRVQAELEIAKFGSVRQDKKGEIIVAVKIQCGGLEILNALEHICVYVKTEIVENDIIFDPISGVFCDFMVQNEDLLESALQYGPFKNIRYVQKLWTTEKILAITNQQMEELAQKKEELLNQKMT